jgi:hypothetical protein
MGAIIMHSALFIAVLPEDERPWGAFERSANTNLKPYSQHIVRLAETVWLVDMKAKPAALAWLIASAASQQVHYGILTFENKPEWLPPEFDPMTVRYQNKRFPARG